MITPRLRAALAAAFVTGVTMGCVDVPLLPTWDADWYVPLSSQRIGLLGPFPAAVPPGTSAQVSFPPQQQSLDDAAGSILDQEMRSANVVLTLSSSIPLDGADTLFIAATSADLTNGSAQRVVVPITLVASVPTFTDTVAVTADGLTMLKNAAAAGGDIFIQLRGSVTYPGPGIRTITASDSIGVRFALLARIAVSR